MGNLTDSALIEAPDVLAEKIPLCDLWTPWHDELYAGMPPEREVRRRNAAVTSKYASFYKSQPELFKWAGAAAFASHRVGLALTPYRAIQRLEDLLGRVDGHHPDLDPDIEILRETNNRVFHDMAWAHAALLTNGFAPIHDELQGRPDHAFMLEGFRQLDQARQLFGGSWQDRRRARQLVWSGTVLLLKQEQFVTVQPQFDRITPGFRVFLSVATAMDFDADHWLFDWFTHTSFPLFMYVRGTPTLIRTRSWPNIARRDHRWLWASESVLKIWRRVDRWDRRLSDRIDRLIRDGSSVAPDFGDGPSSESLGAVGGGAVQASASPQITRT